MKDLLNALNDGDEQKAAKIAGILAGNQEKVQFSLNMINESGNAAPRAPPKPVLVPLKYLFYFQNHSCIEEMFELYFSLDENL